MRTKLDIYVFNPTCINRNLQIQSNLP